MPRYSKISRTPADRDKPHHRGILFIEGVPLDTKAAFKAACARRQTTMRDAFLRFMRDYAVRKD